MPCYSPLAGFEVGVSADTGKKLIKVLKRSRLNDWLRARQHVIPLPCGNCIGCRLERSRQWAMRCVHEASLYDDNVFVTLTFDDENLNENGTLVKEDFQKFFKRLRKWRDEYVYRPDLRKYVKRWKPLSDLGIVLPTRYFHCGEYGSKLKRPHHHACIFNLDFKDKILYKESNGCRLYRSEALESLWTYGYSLIGDVTFDSAAYVARYITKKINGAMAESHYKGKLPEYTTMSRRPGIGNGWFKKFGNDVYSKDEVAIKRNGKVYVMKPAKYYDKLFAVVDPEKYEILKERRVEKAKNDPDNNDVKLCVKHDIKKRQVSRFKRSYENED